MLTYEMVEAAVVVESDDEGVVSTPVLPGGCINKALSDRRHGLLG